MTQPAAAARAMLLQRLHAHAQGTTLRQIARVVDPNHIHTRRFQQLCEDLKVTMRSAGGVGLAAPQVGRAQRVFCMQMLPRHRTQLSRTSDPPAVVTSTSTTPTFTPRTRASQFVTPAQAPPPKPATHTPLFLDDAATPTLASYRRFFLSHTTPLLASASANALDDIDSRMSSLLRVDEQLAAVYDDAYEIDDEPHADARPIIAINPVLDFVSPQTHEANEGCLSIPGFAAAVQRPFAIRVRFLTPDARLRTVQLVGWDARIFQHEFDHLNGVLLIDHLRTDEQLQRVPHGREEADLDDRPR